MINPDLKNSVWWGDYSFDVNQIKRWEIGPLELYIQRYANELLIAFKREEISADTELGWSHDDSVAKMPDDCEIERYAFKEAPSKISLSPMLASKQVVTRPITHFNLMANEQVTVFAGTPVRVKIESADPKVKLTTISTRILSDTWFGVSTQKGELCYSAKTKCRIRLEDVPISANRAITPVKITNLSSKVLELKEINIPVDRLALFNSRDGNLWTSFVSVVRGKDADKVTVALSKTPPNEAEGAVPLADAQNKEKSNVMKNAITAFFGESF